MVEYEDKKLTLREIATFPKWTLVNNKPKGAFYFLRKQNQMINNIRYKKSELKAEIAERLKVGWKNSEIVVEDANLEFLNKIYRSKGDN